MKITVDEKIIDEMSAAVEVLLPELVALMSMIKFRLQYLGEKGYSSDVAMFDILLQQQFVDLARLIRNSGIEPVLERRLMLSGLLTDRTVLKPLARKGITTVADVRERWSEISACEIRHFGPKGLHKLLEALNQHGISIP